MTQTLISIELGDSHYYFISDVVAIRIDEYRSMSSTERNDICTATSRFGEEIPEILITHFKDTPDRSFFYGRRRIWPNQKSKFQRKITRLTSDIDSLYRKVRHLCELHDVNGTAFIAVEPANLDNEELQSFISYIKFTR